MPQRSRRANSSGFSRNGRFSITNDTNAAKNYPVINTGSRSVYRFFNSGKKTTFKVKQANTGGTGVSVEPKNSIDAEISGKVSIRVKKGETVEGIYEFVETNFGVRNGRYSGKLDVTKSPAIIHGRSGSIYRVFNSGEHKFSVKYDGTETALEPRESHDFVVKGIVQISTDSPSEVPIKLIYDYLDSNKLIRSGRLNHKAKNPPAEIKHQIINFTNYADPTNGKKRPYQLYRVFNSGDATIEVYAQSGANTVLKLTDLASDQSFDFGFNADGFVNGNEVNKIVWVRSIDHTQPIKVIYEYLGED